MTDFVGKDFKVSIDTNGHSLAVTGGNFEKMNIFPAPLFHLKLKSTADGSYKTVSSESNWESVTVNGEGCEYCFLFVAPEGISGITVKFTATVGENELVWTGSLENESEEWSAMEMTYPTLSVGNEKFDLFTTETSGIVTKDVGNKGYTYRGDPVYSMQYFAAYGNTGGIYYGIHDPHPFMKRYDVKAQDGKADILVYQVGENGNLPKNSFMLAGKCVWRVLYGDWYDASREYARFVRNEAEWVPKIDENGRPDTPEAFKDIPFWVCDYIPNSPSQGNNKPMKLSAGSDIYDEGYWYNAVIELKEMLGVPIAYHVYNWHSNPFNVNYPHFMPAKDEFIKGLVELKKHGILVTPYINALSWETRDSFDGSFEVTFDNTGGALSVKNEDGSVLVSPYPQTHDDGVSVLLASTCPTTKTWQNIIKDVATEMESTLDIDGIYFDQISASHGSPCYDKTHGHPLGGGRHWCDGYRELMKPIIESKPEGAFYFSEDNTEEFMNLFDGFLTWRWLMNEAVPAFPAVYAGYVQMLGRNQLGEKKEDVEFFKCMLSKSFLYGQQLGWVKADLIYSEEKLRFLKTVVRERYKYSRLFNCSEMLRPPRIESSIAPKYTPAAMHFTEEVKMDQVYAGAWQHRAKDKTVVFIINSAKEDSEYKLSFNNNEYKLDTAALESQGFALSNDGTATKRGKISAESIISLEF